MKNQKINSLNSKINKNDIIFEKWYENLKDVWSNDIELKIGVIIEIVNGKIKRNELIFKNINNKNERAIPMCNEDNSLSVEEIFFSNKSLIEGFNEIGWDMIFIDYILQTFEFEVKCNCDNSNLLHSHYYDLDYTYGNKITWEVIDILMEIIPNDCKEWIIYCLKVYSDVPCKYEHVTINDRFSSEINNKTYEKLVIELIEEEKLSLDVIYSIASYSYCTIPLYLAKKKNISQGIMHALFFNYIEANDIREIIATRDDVPEDLLYLIAEEGDYHMKKMISERKDLSKRILDVLGVI